VNDGRIASTASATERRDAMEGTVQGGPTVDVSPMLESVERLVREIRAARLARTARERGMVEGYGRLFDAVPHETRVSARLAT